jgi:hypothetical protein
VLKRDKNKEKTRSIVHVNSLKEATLRTILANSAKTRATYDSATPLGVSRSPQARPTIMQSMEIMLSTWIENQVKRNSQGNPIDFKVKALHLFEDLKKHFTHETNLEFTTSSG